MSEGQAAGGEGCGGAEDDAGEGRLVETRGAGTGNQNTGDQTIIEGSNTKITVYTREITQRLENSGRPESRSH